MAPRKGNNEWRKWYAHQKTAFDAPITISNPDLPKKWKEWDDQTRTRISRALNVVERTRKTKNKGARNIRRNGAGATDASRRAKHLWLIGRRRIYMEAIRALWTLESTLGVETGPRDGGELDVINDELTIINAELQTVADLRLALDLASANPATAAATRHDLYAQRDVNNETLDAMTSAAPPLPGGLTWELATSLGSGSFGKAWLCVQLDANRNIVHRVTFKDSWFEQPNRQGYWFSPLEWVGNVGEGQPLEAYIQERLRGSDKIVEFRSHTVFMDDLMYRVYMEYCPFGDLHDVIRLYMTTPALYITRIPERVLWYFFEALVEAGCSMGQPRFGRSPGINGANNEVVHRDMKPGNVFFGIASPTYFPKCPIPKLGDWSLAIRSNSDDPNNGYLYTGSGTQGFMPPERPRPARVDVRLGSKTNVWSVGYLMMHIAELTIDDEDKPNFSDEDEPDSSDDNDQLKEPRWSAEADNFYSDEFREMVKECVTYLPANRPTFVKLRNRIRTHIAANNLDQPDSDDDDDDDDSADWFEHRGTPWTVGRAFADAQAAAQVAAAGNGSDSNDSTAGNGSVDNDPAASGFGPAEDEPGEETNGNAEMPDEDDELAEEQEEEQEEDEPDRDDGDVGGNGEGGDDGVYGNVPEYF